MNSIPEVLVYMVVIYMLSVVVAIILSMIKYKVDKSLTYQQKLEDLTCGGEAGISNLLIVFIPILNIWSILYDLVITLSMIYLTIKYFITNKFKIKDKDDSKLKMFLIRLMIGKGR